MFSTNDLEQLMQKVDEYGWGTLSLQPDFWQSLRKRFAQVEDSGLLQKAEVTKSENPHEIRNDLTYWLEPHQGPIEGQLFAALDELSAHLKNYFRISLNDIECHFALYPMGHFYKRHIDQTVENNKRFFSFVIYLNSSWTPAEGGALVGFDSESSEKIFTIWPEGGHIVIFRSDIPHEVQICHKSRRSIAGWLRT